MASARPTRPGLGRAQPAAEKKRRSHDQVGRRQGTVRRAPVHLTRASNLGHRVIQREDAKDELTPEQRLHWQELRTQVRLQKKQLTATWEDQRQQLAQLLSDLAALAKEVQRTRSEKLTQKFVAEARRMIDFKRQHEALELRLKVVLKTSSKFNLWLLARELQDQPEDRRKLADTHPEDLYDRLYQETLLDEPLPRSLGTLAEELRGHYLHLQTLGPEAADFPQVDAYLERIDQLTQELRRLGVTAEDDTLYDLVTGDMRYQDAKLFDDCQIRRRPPGTLTLGERILFQVEPLYLPPGSALEVEWFWRSKDGKNVPFPVKRGKSRQRTLTLDESFWGWLPLEVEERQGIQVVAHLYLNGKYSRVVTSEWVPLKNTIQQSLLDRVQVVVEPQRTIPGGNVSCRLSHWSPPGIGYKVGWVVNGKEIHRSPRTTLERNAGSPGFCQIAARIYRYDSGKWPLFHTTPATLLTISKATDLGREILDAFTEQGLPGLSTVRPGFEKTTAALEEKVAAGGHDAGHWQQRLEAQKGRLEFLDREVPESSSVTPLDDLIQPTEGSRYSSPVPAVLLHPEISGPVPLTLYLVLQYQGKDQWEAKLLDLTGDSPVRYPGSGTTRQAATAAAVLYWQQKNPYPKGGTVTFEAAGWDGAEHFSTTNAEKTVKEWVDTLLLVGGIALMMAPEFTGSKALGTGIILASLARAGYAIYENLTLGVPWYDTRNVLEGLSILGSVAGLSGGVLRSVGAQASRTGVYRTGTFLVLFGLGTDISAAVVVTYQGMAMIQAIEDDPTLDDGQKASQLLRISSMLVLNGVMTFASNRDLFTSPKGSLAGRAVDPGEAGSLGPKTRSALELEVKRRGQGKQLTENGTPISDRRLFEIFCQVRSDEQRLTDVQAELGNDKARREFGRLMRSKRRHQPVDAVTRVRLSRALEVPVHQAPELAAGSVRISYQVQRGRIRKIVVHCGAGTSVDDVLRHAPTVQLLKRYRGMVGRFRTRLDRLRRFFGQHSPTLDDGLAFEAWGELLKLPGMIAARRKELVGRDLEAADRMRLEREIENLRRQLETHLPRVESLARRRGYIASEGTSELPPHLQTVEQRWRLGKEIPQEVLDNPNHYLFDLNVQKWTKLRRPYFGPTRMRAPYGEESFFQFSWEKETGWKEDTSRRIYLFYRPKDVPEKEWFKDALLNGHSYEDLAKTLSEGRLKDLENVIDLNTLKAKIEKKKTAISDMTKTSLAHPKLSDDLKQIPGGWEITHRGFEQDFRRVYSNQGQLSWTIKTFGNRAFHIHVSFPRPTQEADVDDLLTLVTHLNNYAASQLYGPGNGKLIGHGDLGVFGAEQRDELRAMLLGKRGKFGEIDTFFKRHFVGIRFSPYKDGERIGIEFRSLGENVGAPTAKRILDTLRILRDPKKSFSLGGQQKYTLEQLRQPGLIPSQSALKEGLPPKLFDFMKDAAKRARQLPGSTMHPGFRPTETQKPMGRVVKQLQLLVRWSVPFVKWEKHPAIPKEAHSILEDARKLLIERLWAIQNAGEATAETQHAIHEAIAEWAKSTELGKYF